MEYKLKQYIEIKDNQYDYCSKQLSPIKHGLDRKNSSQRYFLSNVIPSCKNCNLTKSYRLTVEEMKVAASAILELRNGLDNSTTINDSRLNDRKKIGSYGPDRKKVNQTFQKAF